MRLFKVSPPGQAARSSKRFESCNRRRLRSTVRVGQGAGVPARSERLQRDLGVGKVGAGDRRGERYLSVYLRVPPAPIARRSEPVAGRVATRSGCPLFCCQEGAKRACGMGRGAGRALGGPASFLGWGEGREGLQDLLWSPSSPQRRDSIGQALLPSFINSFMHSFISQLIPKRAR